MTTPRGFRDRSDDSLFTIVGEIPELVRNLVVAEVDSAKTWVKKTAKDAGIGAGWFAAALVVLFWAVPALGTFAIAGLASWMPVWLAALLIFIVMVIVAVVLALLGLMRFRKLSQRDNPGQSIAIDAKIVKEAVDEF